MFKPEVYIGSIGVALPSFSADQTETKEFLIRHYAHRLQPRSLGVLKKIFSHPSILRRHFAFESPDCLLKETPDSRIARFTQAAVDLSVRAALQSLDQLSLGVSDVSGLVVSTCTGYLCPGLSTYLVERLGLSRRIRAYDLVGAGCGGAIPNLEIAGRMLQEDESGVILSVSVEICSATFQMSDDLSLILSNMLFSDGAAAAVVWKCAQGLKFVTSAGHYAPEYRDCLRYVYKNGQLHNQISNRLPFLVQESVLQSLAGILDPLSLRPDDIKHWAVHPGGEKIINAVQAGIGLSDAQLGPARDILARHGNMSSPTVLFVLRKILETGIEENEWCAMLAFGAGLASHALLLKKR
ncbi:MAG: 3-oxoacyl-[acyl-carrier-protein] synthase III C-terminal domain-containing protein [Pseudomonadota bacterium]